MAELKMCPFCGGEPFVGYSSGEPNYVYCLSCRAQTHFHIGGAAAASAWNRRTSDGLVKIPTSREEAAAMHLIAERWLEDHATPPA